MPLRPGPFASLGTLPLALAVAALAAAPARARAQAYPAPGSYTVDNRVVLAVYVTLADSADPYHPVAAHPLVLYGPGRDSTVLVTDGAGVAAIGVREGAYRLASRDWYRWRGRAYRWNVPVTVRPGMRRVELTAANAAPERSEAAGEVVAEGAAPNAPPGAPPNAAPDTAARVVPPAWPGRGTRERPYVVVRVVSPKDPSAAMLFSAILVGSGQVYAGRPAKGVALFALSAGGVAWGLSARSCDAGGGCHNGPLAAGLGAAAVGWLVSVTTAPGDVRAWNAAHGVLGALPRVAPHLAGGPAGARVGLAAAW